MKLLINILINEYSTNDKLKSLVFYLIKHFIILNLQLFYWHKYSECQIYTKRPCKFSKK